MAMYLTVQEFKNAPTAIDCLNLIPGGTQAQNDAEITNVIRRASAWVNQICKMPTLEATLNTETKEVYLNNSGVLRIHPDMIPIITLLDSVKYKMYPANDWSLMPLSDITVFQRYFSIYCLAETMISPIGTIPFSITSYRDPFTRSNMKNIPIMMQYSYVNGYPNTVLTDDCYADTDTITVKNVTGMVGQTLTIYDGELSEDVMIGSVTDNIVTLAAPMIFDHSAGVSVSALPDSVKMATILLAAFLIKERGSLSISMGTQAVSGVSHSAGTDVNIAKELLRPLVRGVIS